MSKKSYTPLNIIVFSKDRACQLHLFLTSMKYMFKEYKHCEIYVLYTATSPEFTKAYDTLKKSFREINFIFERDFKKDTVSLIDENKAYTVFFVDDIIWKEPFSLNCNEFLRFTEEPDILCLSLRLDPKLTYCYAYDSQMTPPDFDDNRTWGWKGMDGDFGYPMSLDGHIFKTSDIKGELTELKYHNPNSLEGHLSQNPIDKEKMICLEKAPIFNIPANKVQTYNNNRHGDTSAEHLNEMFLSGYKISYEPLIGFNNISCHQETKLIINRSTLNSILNLFR